MKKYVIGAAAALATALATFALGDLINYDMNFLAGWWSCMAWTICTKD